MKKETITLAAVTRPEGENPKVVRRAGNVPGIIYGGKAKNVMVTCSLKALHSVYVKAGENTIVELSVDGKNVACLIHAISFEPVSGREEHVDFYAVDMTKKVTTRVPVMFEGESVAVKTLGGVLVTVHDEVEVTCLPSDIPSHFTVHLSALEKFRDTVTVGSLKVPTGVTIKSSPNTVIITVQEPRKEEVIEVVAPTTEVGGAEGAVAAPSADGAALGAVTGKTDDKAATGGKDKGAKK